MMDIADKYIVQLRVNNGPGGAHTPESFDNLYWHCFDVAKQNGWVHDTVMNYELRSLGGRLIRTKTQGWYLRFDDAAGYTAFTLKWS